MATDEDRLPTDLIIGLLRLVNSEDKQVRSNAKRLLELNALQLAREVVELRDRFDEPDQPS